MLSTLKKHLTYANVMASLAVFAVLGGGMAVAAGLKKNSVKSKTIKDGAVAAIDIKDGSVGTPELAGNAATGAKVDEASLGTVPSAASADSAQSAQTAQNAQNAQSAQTAQTAQNAQNAQNAEVAANASLFDGRSLGQVRTFMQDASTAADDPLTTAEEQVDGLVVNLPNSGTGNVYASASITLTNNGVQAAPQCRLRLNGSAISQQTLDTIPSGQSKQVTLVAMTPNANTGQITIACGGGPSDDDVRFAAGDLVVQKVPVG